MNATPWRKCDYCGKIVKINKPLLGSMHVCLTEAEMTMVDQFRRQQQQQMPRRKPQERR